ncbi:hypothetical protein [Microbacterium sp. C7(2022)]|uniref:hypothetical protein n=1 Tax=Microbacterium sp. C7(2022) TaxID=2992759 RepID=UPI00237B9CF1|nr:hypothetical protein [Microbacterium sp. C7(2022)]MDE0545357.1 hypothetical protein [Microbacterium sp. C7(2022)]
MTDARALRDDEPGTIDRRKLLKIGAWAAPALLVATAVPAASASDVPNEPNPTPAPTVEYSKPVADVLKAETFDAQGGTALGQFNYRVQSFYNYNAWGLPGEQKGNGPSALSFTYTVTLSNGQRTVTPEENVPVTVPAYGTFNPNWKYVTGLEAGEWVATISFGPVIPVPAAVAGNAFELTGSMPTQTAKAIVKTQW